MTANITIKMKKCHEWEYNLTDSHGTTWISEWNLVCDKRTLNSFSVVIFAVGTLAGGIISGTLSHMYGRKMFIFLSLFLQTLCGEYVCANSEHIFILCHLRRSYFVRFTKTPILFVRARYARFSDSFRNVHWSVFGQWNGWRRQVATAGVHILLVSDARFVYGAGGDRVLYVRISGVAIIHWDTRNSIVPIVVRTDNL